MKQKQYTRKLGEPWASISSCHPRPIAREVGAIPLYPVNKAERCVCNAISNIDPILIGIIYMRNDTVYI